METYRLKIRLLGGFITPFQADTLFGAICWLIRYREGTGYLQRMLGDFRRGNPWFVLSNACPGDLLPRPLIRLQRSTAANRDQLLIQAQEGKRLKKIDYLSRTEFIALINGAAPVLENRAKPLVQSSVLHNQINRISGTTGGEGQLFELVESRLAKKGPGGPEERDHQDYLSIYIKIREPALRDWLLELFSLLGQTGLGKRKSAGKGAFSVIAMEQCDFFTSVKEPNGYLSLSHFVPAPADPTRGFYKTFVKYGKLGEEYALTGCPFKYPLLMIRAGGVFFIKGGVRTFYGQMIDNIAPSHPEVLHYALAFSVPVRLAVAN